MGMFDWVTIGENIFKPSSLLGKYGVTPEKLFFQSKDFDKCHEIYSSPLCQHLTNDWISYLHMRHYRFVKNKDNNIIIQQEVDENGEGKELAIDTLKDEDNSNLGTHKIDFNSRVLKAIRYSPFEGQLYACGNKHDNYLQIYINFKSKEGAISEIEGYISEYLHKTGSRRILVSESNLEPYEFSHLPTMDVIKT